MAIVIDAGPPAASGHAADEGKAPLQIRHIEIADLMECIARGRQGFHPGAEIRHVLRRGLRGRRVADPLDRVRLGYFYVAYPLIMGFALLSPFGAAGTYEISRRLEAGEPLSWSPVLGAVWNRTGKDLGWLALVSLFTLIIWLDLAVFLFLMFYGVQRSVAHPSSSPTSSPRTYGLTFLLVGNGLGAIIALIVFSFTAVSPPLVVDRDVDFVTAMTTSVRAVLANPRPMLAWAVGDRHGSRGFVRDPVCRAAGALPGPRPHHLASVPAAHRLAPHPPTSGEPAPGLRASCAAPDTWLKGPRTSDPMASINLSRTGAPPLRLGAHAGVRVWLRRAHGEDEQGDGGTAVSGSSAGTK